MGRDPREALADLEEVVKMVVAGMVEHGEPIGESGGCDEISSNASALETGPRYRSARTSGLHPKGIQNVGEKGRNI